MRTNILNMRSSLIPERLRIMVWVTNRAPKVAKFRLFRRAIGKKKDIPLGIPRDIATVFEIVTDSVFVTRESACTVIIILITVLQGLFLLLVSTVLGISLIDIMNARGFPRAGRVWFGDGGRCITV